MKTVEFKSWFGTHRAQLPECWDDLTEGQAVAWLSRAAHKGADLDPPAIAGLLGLPPEVAQNLTATQWLDLCAPLRWLTSLDTLDAWLIREWRPALGPEEATKSLATGPDAAGQPPEVRPAPGGTGAGLKPPRADFSDLTFEEWIYADTLAGQRRWPALAAVVYRSAAGLRRQRFGLEETERLAGLLESHNDDATRRECEAIGVNYAVLRGRFVQRWPRLFAAPVQTGGEPAAHPPGEGGPTDWLLLLRRLLGERFYEERRAMRLPAAAVMQRLEDCLT